MKPSTAIPNADTLAGIATPLLHWYRGHARLLPWREEPAPYRVWVSEIMLQQTRVAAVMPYFERFLARLPDIPSLAACDEETLMKLWQGLGYYSRARNLKKAARILMEEYGGRLPEDFEALLALPGIGRYTAAAISSIAYGHPHPAVDGNVLRVITRLTLYTGDILRERTKRTVEGALRTVYPPHDGGSMNQALMELGATVCLPNGAPLCAACPLRRLCLAHAEGCASDFPKKHAPKQRKKEQLTVLLLEAANAFALQKRPAAGLLAGLWEFPCLPGKKTKAEVLAWCEENRLPAEEIKKLPAARHIFSHVEWSMTGWHIRLAPQDTAVREESAVNAAMHWATPEKIAEAYSVPSAFAAYLALLPELAAK